MKAEILETQLKNTVNELLCVLDMDIEHIKQSLSRLDELRASIVKRDEGSLRDLLRKIQSEIDSYHGNELKRSSMREQLAHLLGCSTEQIT